MRRYTPGGIWEAMPSDFDGSLGRCTQLLSTSVWPVNCLGCPGPLSGAQQPSIWHIVNLCRQILHTTDRTTRIMGGNPSRSAGFDARAPRIPRNFAIYGSSSGHPKSMYSIFAAISESNVKIRVHASSRRFDIVQSSSGQLSTVFGEHGALLMPFPPGISDQPLGPPIDRAFRDHTRPTASEPVPSYQIPGRRR